MIELMRKEGWVTFSLCVVLYEEVSLLSKDRVCGLSVVRTPPTTTVALPTVKRRGTILVLSVSLIKR